MRSGFEEQEMSYKDWIVRYYSSHEEIPEGHKDGEMRELVHCGECFIKGLCVIHKGMRTDNGFCAWGLKERKDNETD